MRKLLFMFVLLLSSIGMSAQDFEVDGIKYSVQTTSPDYTVKVIGYNADYDGDLVLNGTVTYDEQVYKVVSIKSAVLGLGSDLGAFQGCTKNVIVNDLPYCTEIGSWAFSECSGLTSVGNLSACTIIKNNAFSFSNLSSIGDLSACTTIEYSSFFSCKLTSINIPNCESIGENAFCNAYFESFTVPATCTYIGHTAFGGIEKVYLQSETPPTLEFRNGVTEHLTYSQTFLVPPAALETYRTTGNWTKIKMQIISNEAQLTWDVQTPVLNSIGPDQFENVLTLKVSGNIDSDDIKYIRNKMTNLHHLDMTDATFVASDNEYDTRHKTSDNSVGGFYGKVSLITVKLPTSANKIEGDAFHGCGRLEKVTIPIGIERIDDSAYNWDENRFKGAFEGCDYLRSIRLPEGLTYIGRAAFKGCSIGEIVFPSTLTTIRDNAFSGNNRVGSICLPDNLESIGYSAFNTCYSLSEVYIPSSVESIGEGAFANCNNLTDVYAYPVEPCSMNSNTFSSSTYSAAKLHVPSQSFSDYYGSPTWGQFTEIVRSIYGCITLGNNNEVTIDGDKLEDNTLTTGNISAKKVTYKRTFNTPYATVCLPFAINQETADAAGEFYQFTSVNESYEVVMTKVTEGGLLANTAYIVKPKSLTDEVQFIYENDATPITFPLTAECSTPTAATESDWHFKGAWTVTTFQSIAEGTAIYFFAYSSQGGISPGDFVKTNTASANTKCAPFRAYLEYTGNGDLTGTTGDARRMTRTINALPERMKVVIPESNGTTTEIGTISVERDNDTWFSIDGRKLNGKPVKKGLYINNGKKLVIK